jgi:hypothetical protein
MNLKMLGHNCVSAFFFVKGCLALMALPLCFISAIIYWGQKNWLWVIICAYVACNFLFLSIHQLTKFNEHENKSAEKPSKIFLDAMEKAWNSPETKAKVAKIDARLQQNITKALKEKEV